MSSRPSLGPDIILHLLANLPRQSDVSKMMRTTKSYYAAGIKPLLRFGITISDEQSLVSFCHFVLDDVAIRAPHVRKFYLRIPVEVDSDDFMDGSDSESSDAHNNTSEGMGLLVKVLRETTRLMDLTIDKCEEVLERTAGLSKSIMALHDLRRFQVSSVGVLTASMINKMESSLVEVDLHCHSEEMEEVDDVLPIVVRHQSTLRTLSAWYVVASDAKTQYRSVRSLALRSFYRLDISVLHHVFPNLTYLELTAMVDPYDAEELRTGNKKYQLKSGTWGELNHLCGCLDALYGIALTGGHVKRVDVDFVASDSTSLARFHAVLSETSPSHLLVHTGYFVHKPFHVTKVSELLAAPEASGVTHFVLDMSLSNLKGSGKTLLTGLCSLLGGSSVTFLILRFNKYVEYDDRAQSEAPDPWCNQEVLTAFQPPLHDLIVRQIAEASSHLRYLSLDVMGQRARYWSIIRTGGATSVDELEFMVGRELVYAEGLCFNDRSVPGIQTHIQ